MFNIGKSLLRVIWAYLEVAQLAIGPSKKNTAQIHPMNFLGVLPLSPPTMFLLEIGRKCKQVFSQDQTCEVHYD